MAITLQEFDLPPGYSLHEGDASDDDADGIREGLFWWTYVSPDGSGDPETDEYEHETAECAQVGAWMHHAAEVKAERDALHTELHDLKAALHAVMFSRGLSDPDAFKARALLREAAK